MRQSMCHDFAHVLRADSSARDEPHGGREKNLLALDRGREGCPVSALVARLVRADELGDHVPLGDDERVAGHENGMDLGWD